MIPDERWHNYKNDPPKENGRYIVAIDMSMYPSIPIKKRVDTCEFATNLEEFDRDDFEGATWAGWYLYDSAIGYYERRDITHWMELPSTEGLE